MYKPKYTFKDRPKKLPNIVSVTRKLDLGKALILTMKGLSSKLIAEQLGVHDSSIRHALRPFKPLLELYFKHPDIIGATNAYESNKITLLTLAEMKMLVELVNKDKIKKASLNNVAYAFQQIYNANRLAKGLSTENIDVHELTVSLNELKEQEKELLAKEKELLKEIGIENIDMEVVENVV